MLPTIEIEPETTQYITLESSSLFCFSLKRRLVGTKLLTDEEKQDIITSLPDNGKIKDTTTFLKALKYHTYKKTPRPISQENIDSITPETLLSFVYLNYKGVDMSRIYKKYPFEASLDVIVPLTQILETRGISVEDALRFHPELLKMSTDRIEEVLDLQLTSPILTDEEIHTISMLEELKDDDLKYQGKKIQEILFVALQKTHSSLLPEQSLLPLRNIVTERLIEHNTPLVKHFLSVIINRTKRGDLEEYLLLEGKIGLAEAIKRFDPDLGFAFATYAEDWITQYMRKFLVKESSDIDIPDRKRYELRKYYQVESELVQKYGKVNIPQELVLEEMRKRYDFMKARKGQDLVAALNQCRKACFQFDEELYYPDHKSPERILTKHESKKNFSDKLYATLADKLTETEFNLFLTKYPLTENSHTVSDEEIARKFGITREAIRQRMRKIEKKLSQSEELRNLWLQ